MLTKKIILVVDVVVDAVVVVTVVVVIIVDISVNCHRHSFIFTNDLVTKG